MSNFEKLIQSDYCHTIQPHLSDSQKTRVIFARGKDCNLSDVQGREYLDATGGLWLAQIGHGREEMAEAAARQMKQLEYATCFWEYSHERATATGFLEAREGSDPDLPHVAYLTPPQPAAIIFSK